MQVSIDAHCARRSQAQQTPMNLVAAVFAWAAGVEPDPDAFPGLRRGQMFGPLAPSHHQLTGPDALPDAAGRSTCTATRSTIGARSSDTRWTPGGDDGTRTHDPLLAKQVLSPTELRPRGAEPTGTPFRADRRSALRGGTRRIPTPGRP